MEKKSKNKVSASERGFNDSLLRLKSYSKEASSTFSDLNDISLSLNLQFRNIVDKLQKIGKHALTFQEQLERSVRLNRQIELLSTEIYKIQDKQVKKQIEASIRDERRGKDKQKYIGLLDEELDVYIQTKEIVKNIEQNKGRLINNLKKETREAINRLDIETEYLIRNETSERRKSEILKQAAREKNSIVDGYLSEYKILQNISNLENQVLENLQLQAKIRKQGELQKLEESLAKELGIDLDIFKQIKSLIKDFGPGLGLAAIGLIGIGKLAHTVYESFEAIHKTGKSIEQSFEGIGKSLGIYNLFGVRTSEIYATMTDTAGDLESINRSLVQSASKMSLYYGISEQAVSQLYGKTVKLSGFTQDSVKDTADFAAHLAKANKVAPGRTLESIANNTKAFALYGGKSNDALIKAAVAAQKIGVQFENILGTVDKLLDFESSMNDQFEASILLGREINFDRARQLALNNDVLGATKEIVSQIGTEQDFLKLNNIQRQALAKSAGLEVEDLSILIKNREKLNDLTDEQISKLHDTQDIMAIVKHTSAGISDVAHLTLESLNKWGPGLLLSLGPLTQLIGKVKLLKLESLREAIASAWSAAMKNPLAILGGGLVLGGLATAAIMASMKSAHDAVITPHKGMVVSGPRGAIQLDKDDSIIAGTNLGGKSKTQDTNSENKELINSIKELVSLVKQGSIITLDGRKVGEAIILATPKSQFVTNIPR